MTGTIQRETPFEARLAPADDHLLVVHLDGPVKVSGTIDKQTSVHRVPPGALYLWPAGRSFDVRLDGTVDTFHLHIPTSLVNDVGSSIVGRESWRVPLEPRMCVTDPLLEQLALEICRLLKRRSSASALHADILLNSIAAQLVAHHSSVRVKISEAPEAGLAPRQLARLTDYIEEHLDLSLSLGELARVTGLSPSHFVRQFRASTGQSPHQFLMKRRVERVRSLLLNSRHGLAQIALECGFSHQEHMTNTFRRLTGVTPAHFRRQAE